MSIAYPILSIVIPTYNRPLQLVNTLNKLLPQITDSCCLVIIDNCSDIPVEETTKSVFEKYPKKNYKIYRNRVNIGGDSNVMRCFEYCETKWLWTLGDDDDITGNAIEMIQNDILTNPDVTNINYYSPHKFHPVRDSLKVAMGRKEFVSKADSLGASIFISSNIYNTTKLAEHWLANHNTYSCIAQWLIVYYSLHEKDQVIYSNKIICYNNFKPLEYSNFVLSIATGLATLFDIYTSREEKIELIRFVKTAAIRWITLEKIFNALLIDYMRSSKKLDIEFVFSRYYSSFFKHLGLFITLRYYLYSLIVNISPSLSFQILRLIMLKRRNIDLNTYIRP